MIILISTNSIAVRARELSVVNYWEWNEGIEMLILSLQSHGTGWCRGSTCCLTAVLSRCLRNISFHAGYKYSALGCQDLIQTTTRWRAGTKAGRLCFHSSCLQTPQLKVLITFICLSPSPWNLGLSMCCTCVDIKTVFSVCLQFFRHVHVKKTGKWSKAFRYCIIDV